MPAIPYRLTIGISSLASEVSGIRLPAPRDDTEVIVAIQGGDDDWAHLKRADVKVDLLPSFGVARSRNHVLESGRGEYVLFADADSSVLTDGVSAALRYLDERPELGLLLGRTLDGEGQQRKRYHRRPRRLTRWNSARAGTVELIVRRSSQAKVDIWFDPKFGAGSPNFLGDEYIFITDLLREGVAAVAAPFDLATHPRQSSGTSQSDSAFAVRASVFQRVFGPLAPVARLLFLLRARRRVGGIRNAIRFIAGNGRVSAR